jgi:hypothetical protein
MISMDYCVFYDENGEFVIDPPEDFSNPLIGDTMIKWHFCTKCYKYFHSPEDLKIHSKSCDPKFANIVWQDGDYYIAQVNSRSSLEEKTICE